jgi:hypothetical protein
MPTTKFKRKQAKLQRLANPNAFGSFEAGK